MQQTTRTFEITQICVISDVYLRSRFGRVSRPPGRSSTPAPMATRSPTRPPATAPCATTAPGCRPWPAASPPPSTQSWPRSPASTPAPGWARPAPSASTCPARPRALGAKDTIRWLRTVERWLSPRDRVIALAAVPCRAAPGRDRRPGPGRRAAAGPQGPDHRAGRQRRPLPRDPRARRAASPSPCGSAMNAPAGPGADTSPALLLNRRGGRLSARGAHDILLAIAAEARLDPGFSGHALRHTFGTRLKGRPRPRPGRRAHGTRPDPDHPRLRPAHRRRCPGRHQQPPRRPLTSGSACYCVVSGVLRPDPVPWHHRSRRKAGPDGRVLDHQRGR